MFRGAGTAYAGAILGLLLIAPTGKPQQNEVGNSSSSKTTSVERKKSLETRQVKPLQEKPVAMDRGNGNHTSFSGHFPYAGDW